MAGPGAARQGKAGQGKDKKLLNGLLFTEMILIKYIINL